MFPAKPGGFPMSSLNGAVQYFILHDTIKIPETVEEIHSTSLNHKLNMLFSRSFVTINFHT